MRQLEREVSQLRNENHSLRERLQFSSKMEEHFLQRVEECLHERIDYFRNQTLLDCQAQFDYLRQEVERQPSRRRY